MKNLKNILGFTICATLWATAVITIGNNKTPQAMTITLGFCF